MFVTDVTKIQDSVRAPVTSEFTDQELDAVCGGENAGLVLTGLAVGLTIVGGLERVGKAAEKLVKSAL
jgi:hypothetical protein